MALATAARNASRYLRDRVFGKRGSRGMPKELSADLARRLGSRGTQSDYARSRGLPRELPAELVRRLQEEAKQRQAVPGGPPSPAGSPQPSGDPGELIPQPGQRPIQPRSGTESRPGPPPVVTGDEPRRPATGGAVGRGDEEYDDVTLIGRDAGYHPDDFKELMRKMRHTPGSSNVYGYFYQPEDKNKGILYVTFLGHVNTNTGPNRGGAGPTYAYYNVSATKFKEFDRKAASSAGEAVWDYLRVRQTLWQHQHSYRLVQPGGEYIPRKVTKHGFRDRAVPAISAGRRTYRWSTLDQKLFGKPGDPDYGGPNRGRPNPGRRPTGRTRRSD